MAASKDQWEDVSDDQSNVLIIGIDFGTTFSGAAWATPYDFEQGQINLIHKWPGTGFEKGKAPTELFYEDGEVYWGYEIPPDANPLQWFKLLLLRDQDLGHDLRNSKYVRRGQRMLRETGKTATDLVADYLRLLWTHVLETIRRDRGDAAVDGMRFRVVLTVPAIWQGYARQHMEDAAAQAGILDDRPAGKTELSLATEPEAAALSTLDNNPNRCKKGDVFIICDAGGGTVDLISYKVTRAAPVIMEEAVEGAGGLFGSIFIDEAFEKMSQRRLGPKWASLSKKGIKELVQGEWQQAIKPQYKPRPNSRRNYTVSIPAEVFDSRAEMTDLSKEPYIKMGRFHLTDEHIEALFAYSFKGIDRLIGKQIAEIGKRKGLAVTNIILVGGLGASPYLYEHLKAVHGPAIKVLQSTGTKPWTAICRGAVYKGFYRGHKPDAGATGDNRLLQEPPIQIASTVSRFSVGILFSSLFDKDVHLPQDRYWDEEEETYFADNQMKWYLRKGESVKTLRPVRHKFYRVVTPAMAKIKWTTEIFLCHDPEPPSRRKANVKPLGKIHCGFTTFEDLPDYQLPSRKMVKEFKYEIVMIPSGAAVEFVVYHEHQQIASQMVNVYLDQSI